MARKIWISAIAAGAALGLASPSLASERGAASSAGASTASAATAAAAASEKKDERVCLVTKLTGSRISRKVCRTELEWEKEGVDIQKEMSRAK